MTGRHLNKPIKEKGPEVETRYKFRTWNKDIKSYEPPNLTFISQPLSEYIKNITKDGYVLESWIGLTDKNDTDIYEGDVLKFTRMKYPVNYEEDVKKGILKEVSREVCYDYVYFDNGCYRYGSCSFDGYVSYKGFSDRIYYVATSKLSKDVPEGNGDNFFSPNQQNPPHSPHSHKNSENIYTRTRFRDYDFEIVGHIHMDNETFDEITLNERVKKMIKPKETESCTNSNSPTVISSTEIINPDKLNNKFNKRLTGYDLL